MNIEVLKWGENIEVFRSPAARGRVSSHGPAGGDVSLRDSAAEVVDIAGRGLQPGGAKSFSRRDGENIRWNRPAPGFQGKWQGVWGLKARVRS